MPANHVTKARAAPQRERFVLTGHSAAIDPLVDVVRDDLADVMLADRVFAPHYARALRCTVVVSASICELPNATVIGRVNIGDELDLFDVGAGWGWVRTANAVGYVPADCIEPS